MEKKKFIQITHTGSKVVHRIEDAMAFVGTIEDGEVYVFRAVYLTEEEFQNLPEFTGF